MDQPPYGICYPILVVSVHDGDTLTARTYDPHSKIPGLLHENVRLLDCWAPEVHKLAAREKGLAAKAYLQQLISRASSFALWVPLASTLGGMTTLGRILGRVFADGVDLSEAMVAAGHATRDKSEVGRVKSETKKSETKSKSTKSTKGR